MRRYLQLAVITVAAGAIYPLLYLRQNFEVSMLETFDITATQLGQCNAILGVLFVVTYLPSGWLADRIRPRFLMSFSLLAAGLLGLWFAAAPSLAELRIIYAGWGIATGLTFWSAHIKAVAVLAEEKEQGRFFGVLDGGRGLIEALLATVAIALFAYWLTELGKPTGAALRTVIWLYAGNMLVLAPVVLLTVDDNRAEGGDRRVASLRETAADLRLVLSKPEIWLAALCIMAGYQLFFATYAFSAYMQQNFGLTAVTAGMITVAKQWMRPLGAIGAGLVGDYWGREKVLGTLLVVGSAALASLAVLPLDAAAPVLLAIVLAVGLITYAVRGVYWATLERCDVPDRVKGFAIGVISLVGYAPDIYLPLIRGELVDRIPGQWGYGIYFLGLAAFGLLGAAAAWRLGRRPR
ncbi:MAG: MFS transporter [Gammaproteobacteria bacterium]|nr:MFS transporter [Gammaproteobacteria bacterium]MYB37979.1 MFS transporter [Gammaproteobacteria bacterium]